MRFVAVPCLAAVVIVGAVALKGQGPNVFPESLEHPAILYTTGPLGDPASQLNRDIQAGRVDLSFDRTTGYLPALLANLHVPVESQTLVFSMTSAQAEQISPENPRAIFFNDRTAIGWTRGSGSIEIADQDPQQGVIFYTLDQKAQEQPQLKQANSCLLCHLSPDTLGVPGLLTISTFPMSDDKNAYASGIAVDHRTPVDQRWGGWYVTGRLAPRYHLGNRPVIRPAATLMEPVSPAPQFESVEGRFDTAGYPSRYSDVAALMVLNHQTHAANLLTRLGWEARLAEYQKSRPPMARGTVRDTSVDRVGEAVMDLVDYLLFVDEAPLTARVQGSSGFAGVFAAQGPRDAKGRSLHELDLNRRLMRYPCSYMIYTPAFDALPGSAKRAVYQRLWDVLSGREQNPKYRVLSVGDRKAIVEILRETKTDLPGFFQAVVR